MNKIVRTGFVDKLLILIGLVVTGIYISWWFRFDNAANVILYGLLFFGEVFHVIILLIFFWTVWPRRAARPVGTPSDFIPSVDVYIPVAGEPEEIVKKTVGAAKAINYPNFQIYLLNDGYVAQKDNWKDMEKLAKEENIACITRKEPGGAKAGNINHALKNTNGEIIVIFDADMLAHKNFLTETIPYFQDERVAFVQTPQYYSNHELNEVTGAAWDQQEFFYGPVMIGKEKSNAAFICGTNVAIRRKALLEVGGMNETSITEDVLTSLYIHQRGWKSYYVSKVLAEGLAPEDLLSYYKQQLRWARGGLDLFFRHNPLFKGGLSFAQRIEYLSSAIYYTSGIIVLIDIAMPLTFLTFGIQPVKVATAVFAYYFLPYIFVLLYLMYRASDGSLTFRAFSFSFSSFTLQLNALFSLLTGKKMGFVVTPKKAQEGNFSFLAYPHLFYIFIFVVAVIIAVFREGFSSAVAVNIAWALFNITLFVPFIKAALEGG